MALRAYEVRLIVSAQDHFSGAFRKVGNDIRYIQRLQAKAMKEQIALEKQLATVTRKRAAALQRARTLRDTSGIEAKKAAINERLIRQTEALKKKEDALNNTRLNKNRILARELKTTVQRDRLDRQIRSMAAAKGQGNLSKKDVTKLEDLKKLRKAANLELQRMPVDLASATAAVRQAQAAYDAQAKSIAGNRAALAALNGELARNKALEKEVRAAAKLYGVEQDVIRSKLAARAAQEARINRLQQLRTRISAAGGMGRTAQLAGGIGLAIGAGFASAGANFDKKAMLAATQTPGTVEGGAKRTVANAKLLSDEILRLMKLFPYAADEFNKSAYDIFSSITLAGKTDTEQFASGLKVMKLASSAAVAGLTDLDTATRATIVLANDFGGSFEEMSANLDTAFAIVRYGAMGFDDFTNMLTKVAPAAKAAGMSLQDVGGIMAFLTKRSGKPQEAATWIARVLQILQTPEFIKGMRLLHAPIDKDGKLVSLTEAVSQIMRLSVAKPGLGMQNIIPYITSVGKHGAEGGAGLRSTIQAQRGLVFTATDIAEFKRDTQLVLADKGEMARSLAVMYNTTGMKWDRMINGMKVAALEFGTAILPIMLKVGEFIGRVVDKFSRLPQSMQTGIAMAFVVISAFSLIAGSVVALVASISSLIIMLKILRTQQALTAGSSVAAAAAAGGFATKLGALSKLLMFLGKGVWPIAVALTIREFGEKIPGIEKAQNAWQKGWGWLDDNVVPGDRIFLKAKDDPVWKKDAKKAGEKKGKTGFEAWLDGLMKSVKKGQSELGVKQLKKMMADETKALNEILKQTTTDGADKNTAAAQRAADAAAQASNMAAQIAARRIDAISQGTDKMVGDIRSKIQMLEDTWNQFKETEKNALGGLFAGQTGNIGQDILMDVYQGLAKYNIAPPASLLAKQSQLQLKNYTKLQSDFARIRKRGGSEEFVQQLKGMGEQGRLIAQSVAGAGSGQFKSIMASFNEGQKAVESAATLDFTNALSQWETYGKNAAHSIVTGLLSQSGQLRKAFEDFVMPDLETGLDAWIKTTFPGLILRAAQEAARAFDADATNQQDIKEAAEAKSRAGRLKAEAAVVGKGKLPMPGPPGGAARAPGVIPRSYYSNIGAPNGGRGTGVIGTEMHNTTIIHADGASEAAVTRALKLREQALKYKRPT